MDKSLIGNEFEAEGGGGVVEAGEFFALHFFLFFFEHIWIKWLAIFEEVPEDTRQFVRHRRDGLGSSQACFPAAVEVAKVVLRLIQGLRGQSQRGGGPAFHVTRGGKPPVLRAAGAVGRGPAPTP